MEERERDLPMVLAGDIGGSKTHLGLYRLGKGRPGLILLETYSSRDFSNLEDLVSRFLKAHPVSVQAVCFGVAGPVMGGKCRTTNLPWEVSEIRLKRRFKGSRVRLLNDLTATALAIPLLAARERITLNPVRPARRGNLGLVAPGTGLGEALLVFDGRKYIPVPSEGGHADFPVSSADHLDLWRYLRERYSHVSVERVLSGPGLVNIYSWLRDSGRFRESPHIGMRLGGTDPARVISEEGLRGEDPLCREALYQFVALLGAEAGNMALKGMTLGGVFLGGGIPPKILGALKEGPFLEAFFHKGRFAALMRRIPVRVILNDKTALLGAALCAAECV